MMKLLFFVTLLAWGNLLPVLSQARNFDKAAAAYSHAEGLGLDSAELYYNRGLLELQRDNLDDAATYAAKAYAGGYPLPGLRNKLAEAGVRIPDS